MRLWSKKGNGGLHRGSLFIPEVRKTLSVFSSLNVTYEAFETSLHPPYGRYAAIAMASKLSDMQLGDSMDIGPFLTKKELKQTRWSNRVFPESDAHNMIQEMSHERPFFFPVQ